MAKDITKLVAKIEQKQEVKEEVANFDSELALLKQAVSKLIECTNKVEHASNDTDELVKAMNAAKDSLDNAVTGICNAIVQAQQTPLKVEMTDESKNVMEDGRKNMLKREAELFANHERAIGKSIKTMETKFKNIVDDFKGVWIDKKTFNRYFWGFIGMVELTIISVVCVICYWARFGPPWK